MCCDDAFTARHRLDQPGVTDTPIEQLAKNDWKKGASAPFFVYVLMLQSLALVPMYQR